MTKRHVYSRRISSEEAREGYILVLKNKLPFFPSLGTDFELVRDRRPRKVRMKSYSGTCRGPDEPHEHYLIQWKGLKPKDQVEIREDPRKQGRYLLTTRR